MITAIVLHIVITAQMTVPWIGANKSTTPAQLPFCPLVLKSGAVLVLSVKTPLVLTLN